MDLSDLAAVLARRYDDELIPLLADYVRIPAKSPMFDASWAEHGHLAAVVDAAAKWARAQPVTGLKVEIVAIPGRTPCLYFEAPATQGLGGDRTVLFYGHLDKQPEMTGWRADLGPWTPKIEDGKLYGRGSADDGYAIYAALAALAAMDAQDIPAPAAWG